ncbi:GNAT family N-acetyltransferase [Metabacillus malikii]|uniref:GNAT superfamily N-acetyltransferase n=1 Tax=Metabacillus malikii TaxID=1504265 RepID=A0ABT9ZBH6_9BACI|nr:GNAT family N-acetyltransferase [Metabacillus malikii]MDQ0229161.1 GNAT superfamily N-acetyltransferase [Metabacillus malikii]
MVKKSWEHEDYLITIDKADLELDVIYNFLSNESYWSKGISKEDVIKSINNSSLCFGLYYINPIDRKKNQIGFARVISDLVTHAYIQDVFILTPYRKKGLGKWLLKVITNYEELNIRRIMLSTDDGHSFYAKFGFTPFDKPTFFMQIKGKGAI